MTVLKFDIGMRPSGALGDTTVNGISQTLNRLNYITFTTETASTAIGDFRVLGLPGLLYRFTGFGFQYDLAGFPIGGIITGISITYNGLPCADFSAIAIPVPSLVSWAISGDWSSAARAFFAGDDVIVGTNDNEALQGWGGDDTYLPGLGRDSVTGGSGIDAVVLGSLLRKTTVTGDPQTSATVSAAGIGDSLQAVDRIQFMDGTRYYDSGSPAAQTIRMYDTALGRTPDAPGLAAWTGALQAGAAISQIADGFVSSPEFQVRYPGATQDVTVFIT